MDHIEALTDTLQQTNPAISYQSELSALHKHTIDGVTPRLLTMPASVEEVAKVMAEAHQQRLTVLPWGGGIHMQLGSLPEQIDVILKTNTLKRILEHEAPDLTCHIEAGITLAALQTQLALKGQKIALDPPGAEQATLGGLLATNASGPKRLRYGSARDLVIGLRVVQANGEIARSGGNVVKNVAGYDLNKLYIGSLGTLGIIVEANFKLHPIPPDERTLLLTYSSAEAAMHAVHALMASQLAPDALELADREAAHTILDHGTLQLPAGGYLLAINFAGSSATIARQIDETRLLAREHHIVREDDLAGEEQEHFWARVRTHMQGNIICKVAILVSQVTSYLQHIQQICRRRELAAATIAHAGNGILFISLRPEDAIARLSEAIAELRIHAHAARGSLVVERSPGALKQHVSVWGEPGPAFPLMQRLKQQFDPTGTFVRGRFVGRL